jgi:hypothetical protein
MKSRLRTAFHVSEEKDGMTLAILLIGHQSPFGMVDKIQTI